MKLVRCRDHGFDCEFEAHSHSEDEVLQAAGKHAVEVHKLTITPELVQAVKGSIRDVRDLPA
jgi:predicted small metal-binding protein